MGLAFVPLLVGATSLPVATDGIAAWLAAGGIHGPSFLVEMATLVVNLSPIALCCVLLIGGQMLVSPFVSDTVAALSRGRLIGTYFGISSVVQGVGAALGNLAGGAAFDLGQSEVLGRKVSKAYAAGRVIGGICHGPLGLLKGRTPDGEPIVKGRRVTAVTNKQVHEVGVDITPLHPETELRNAGALFESETHRVKDFFANHFVADGDLITGQNQNAGPMVARLMMQRVLSKQTAGERRAS